MNEEKDSKKKKEKIPELTEIPGIGPTTEQKLKDNGYSKVINLAVAVPKTLADITGMSEVACRKIINYARELMHMDFKNGLDVTINQDKNSKYLKFGCKPLDDLTQGLRAGWITEVYGAWGCHDNLTKVLTKEGVKDHKDIKIGDKILGVSNGKIVESKVLDVHEYDYNGILYGFKNRRINICVTPNHKVYFKRYGQKIYIKINAEDAYGVSGYIPIKFDYEGISMDFFDFKEYIPKKELTYPKKSHITYANKIRTDIFMKIVGWFISEGCIFKSKRGHYVDISQCNKDKRFIIEQLLIESGLKYGKYTNKFIIFHQDLAEYLKKCGMSAEKKQIPQELFLLDKKYLKYMFETMMLGDGENNGYKYYTSSKKLAEQMLVLANMLGYSAFFRKRKWKNSTICGRDIIQKNQSYVINIAPKPKGFIDRRYNMYTKHYNDKVWCFTTTTDNFFTIREGIPTLSGNSSKTQIAFQLCSMAQLPEEQGGFGDCKVIYIDTENTYVGSRIRQIAEAKGLDPDKVLNNILYLRVFNSDHQIFAIQEIDKLLQQGENIKLIIVDSLTAHFRSDFSGRGELYDRQSALNRHMRYLQNLATQYNLVVFVTNQVMSNPAGIYGDPTVAVGGNILGHNSTVRLYLRRATKGTRVAKLVDSPHLPDGECAYMVTDKGLEEV